MKLIIEIPYHIYEMVTNTGTFGCYRFDTRKAIKNGTPLDDIRKKIDKLEYLNIEDGSDGYDKYIEQYEVLKIIDKYKGERE